MKSRHKVAAKGQCKDALELHGTPLTLFCVKQIGHKGPHMNYGYDEGVIKDSYRIYWGKKVFTEK